MKKYLFVCYANKNRSPTAEYVCNEIAKEKGLEIKANSAGYCADDDCNELSEFLLETSDKIFLMEENMIKILERNYETKIPKDKIVVLDIPDEYQRGQPELVNILRYKLEEWMK